MLEFFIDNIFAMFGGRVFQQTVGISLGTNCAPFLSDFILGLLKKNEKKLAQSFNFTFRYIDDNGFPIIWFWAYLTKVIPETYRAVNSIPVFSEGSMLLICF